MIIDKIGLGNLATFISTYIATSFDIIHFAEYWTQAMFVISGTAAAIYGILKIIDWCRLNKKIRNDG